MFSTHRLRRALEPLGGEISALERHANQLLEALSDGLTRAQRASELVVHLTADGDTLTAVAELPGVDPDAIELTIEGQQLRLTASRSEASGTARHRERWAGQRQATVALPYPVDAEQVEARYEHGLLEVRLQRVASERRRTIPIQKA